MSDDDYPSYASADIGMDDPAPGIGKLTASPEVTEALRRFYRYGEGRFLDQAPPKVPTWGGAQLRMLDALRPLMEENARLRSRLNGRGYAP